MNLLTRWVIAAVAVGIASYVLPGVSVDSIWIAIIVAAVIGLVNVIVRPILIILTLPITIVTLGLFLLVINAALILLVSKLVPGFHVAGWGWALLFSIIMSIVSAILKAPSTKSSQEW